MDIKEIERLHAQYAAPPVTIEMDASGKASLDAAAPAASQLPPARNAAIVARIKPIHWQCLGILAVAVLAFGGGRWLASSDARKPSEKAVAAQPEAAGSPSVENGHEWPASQPSVSQPPAASGTPAPSAAQLASSGASASTPTAAAPQNVARPQPPKAQTSKQPTSVPTATRQAPTTPAPIHPPAPAAGRGNEIKLF